MRRGVPDPEEALLQQATDPKFGRRPIEELSEAELDALIAEHSRPKRRPIEELSEAELDAMIAQHASTTNLPMEDTRSQRPGVWEGMKRAHAQGGIGLLQAWNAVQKALPEGSILTYDNGRPLTRAELDTRGETLRQVASDLEEQGKGTGVGGTIGEIFGDWKTYIPGAQLGRVSAPIVQALSQGALTGAVGPKTSENDMVTRAKDTVVDALFSGAVGGLTDKTLGFLMRPVKNSLTNEEQRLAKVAKEEGIELTPAQKTGSRVLKQLEGAFDNTWFSSGKQDEVRDAQLKQFTQAALRKLGSDEPDALEAIAAQGIDPTEASPRLIDTLEDVIGKRFGTITSKHTMPIDPMLEAELKEIKQNYANAIIDPLKNQQLDAVINDILHRTRGKVDPSQDVVLSLLGQKKVLPGEQYQNTRSQIGKIAKSHWVTDPTYSDALRDLQSAMDKAMERGIPPAERGKLAQAREQYENLMVLMKAVGSTGQDATAGFVPPAKLAMAASSGNNKRRYVRGEGGMNDIARLGNAFLKSSIPDSGTATRTMMQRILQGSSPAVGGTIGVGAGAVLGGPIGATLGGLGGMALPMLIQKLYYGAPEYFTQGVPSSQTAQKVLGGLGINIPPEALVRALMTRGAVGSFDLSE